LRRLRELSIEQLPILQKKELDDRFDLIASCFKRSIDLSCRSGDDAKKMSDKENYFDTTPIGDALVLASSRKESQVSMLTKVTRLERLGGFRLRVRFNDDSDGTHDFTAMVNEPGPMLEPLRDEVYFARVFLEFGAPTWPNGFDIAPEWLRREMVAASELTRVAAE
jgi:Protein of unknown function (DUF2442)